MNLPEKDRLAYKRYQYELSYQASLIESNYGLGRLEGREEGREEVMIAVARRLIAMGMSVEEAAEVAGISSDLLRN